MLNHITILGGRRVGAFFRHGLHKQKRVCFNSLSTVEEEIEMTRAKEKRLALFFIAHTERHKEFIYSQAQASERQMNSRTLKLKIEYPTYLNELNTGNVQHGCLWKISAQFLNPLLEAEIKEFDSLASNCHRQKTPHLSN